MRGKIERERRGRIGRRMRWMVNRRDIWFRRRKVFVGCKIRCGRCGWGGL